MNLKKAIHSRKDAKEFSNLTQWKIHPIGDGTAADIYRVSWRSLRLCVVNCFFLDESWHEAGPACLPYAQRRIDRMKIELSA
jgi:hypothetical protein